MLVQIRDLTVFLSELAYGQVAVGGGVRTQGERDPLGRQVFQFDRARDSLFAIFAGYALMGPVEKLYWLFAPAAGRKSLGKVDTEPVESKS